jgi:hypothetical protein
MLKMQISPSELQESVVETGSHKHKGAVEDLDKVVLSGLKH